MSVQNESVATGESVVLQGTQTGGVYASLFEKINLNPVTALSALDIWQDAQAIPATLTPAQLDALRQHAPIPQSLFADTQQQLVRLGQLPPDWNIDYRRQLVEQAQSLWPEQAKPLAQQWLRQLNAASIPTENLNGWHQGMTKLQQLSNQLSGLDGHKGKYMTVSELKSSVFGMITSFQQTEPTEEQLRQINLLPVGSPRRQQLIRQLEQHLRSQIYTLGQMKNSAPVTTLLHK